MSLQAFEPGRKRRGKKKAAPKAANPFADGGVIEIPPDPQPESDSNVTIDPETGSVEIDNDDGSITIDPTGASLWQKPDGDESFGENLALKIDPLELSRIAEEVLTAIAADKSDRSQWENMRAKCIELLGMKLEDPKGDVSRSAMGMSTSVVRDPILLEAVERFRANAYAELCPSSGPVKVVNFSDEVADTDGLAEALQKDLNFYLTTTASEYYPDTRYMLWWTGLASGTFKKVYKCPLRNRPVSEYVDGTDLIVPSNATDLKNASRITHEVSMPRDIMRAMQLEGVYRDIDLTEPLQAQMNPVDLKKASVEGKAPMAQRTEDQEYTVFECYCKLDIKGYEHEKDGAPTGLPLPYRVTIDDTSREVLEIRRNWDEDDDNEVYRPAQIPFVLFPYSTGISRIYGSGLGQMMGNMASALTALLRISIDNGMMSNYPGLLKAKGSGRQITNEIMVPPGGVAEIDTGGLPIQQSVMGMPFKDVSANVVQLIEQTRAVAQRLGGTADMPVGEGRQDAPVGTTLAMIEQATKIEGSVHKALHAAQSEEFRLLVKLFQDDPEALWRGNRRPAMGNAADDTARAARLEKFKRALDNCDIQPMADPNVPSGMHRNLMAMGFKQFTAGNPAYDQVKVDRYVAKQMFKMGDNDFNSMLAPPQQAQPDPVVAAQLELEARKVGTQEAKVQIEAQKVALAAQNDEANRASRENIASLQMAAKVSTAPGHQPEVPAGPDPIKVMDLRIKASQVAQKDKELEFKAANAQLDRQSKETIEALKIAQAVAVHPGSNPLVDEQLEQMAPFLSPAKGGGMANGGRVGYADGGSAFDRWLGTVGGTPNQTAPVAPSQQPVAFGSQPIAQPATSPFQSYPQKPVASPFVGNGNLPSSGAALSGMSQPMWNAPAGSMMSGMSQPTYGKPTGSTFSGQSQPVASQPGGMLSGLTAAQPAPNNGAMSGVSQPAPVQTGGMFSGVSQPVQTVPTNGAMSGISQPTPDVTRTGPALSGFGGSLSGISQPFQVENRGGIDYGSDTASPNFGAMRSGFARGGFVRDESDETELIIERALQIARMYQDRGMSGHV